MTYLRRFADIARASAIAPSGRAHSLNTPSFTPHDMYIMLGFRSCSKATMAQIINLSKYIVMCSSES